MSENYGADLNHGVRKARFKLLLSLVPFVVSLLLLLWFIGAKVLVSEQIVEQTNESLRQEDQPVDKLTVEEFLSLSNTTLDISPEGRLIVNGELKANGAFVLEAVDDPQDAKAGQIFFSKQTNEIKYFDGEQFLTLDNRNLESTVCFKGASDCGFVTQNEVAQLITQQQISIPLPVNVSTLTNNGVLLGQGTGKIIATSAPGAGQVLIGNAGGIPTFTTINGSIQVNANGTATLNANSVGGSELSSSGVAAGTYGSNIEVPVFTVDADGRITSVTNTAIPTGGLGDIINGGQAGPIVVGANDASLLSLETNNVARLTISATGQVAITNLNCSTNVNGGALTADASGNIICSDDDGGSSSGITSLNGQSGNSQSFANDANLTISSAGDVHTLAWNGTLSVARGGTGSGTAQGAINTLSGLTTNGDILYFDGTNSTRLPRGTANQCLISTIGTIQWGSCTAGGGGFTNLTLAGDGGTSQTLVDTDTVTISGGTNVATTANATDTLIIDVIDNPTFAGLITANGGLTVQAGDTITINGEAFTDFTGTGLVFNSGALEAALGISIDSSEITNGTILFADLAANGCGNNDIIKFNGSAWFCGTDADSDTVLTEAQVEAFIFDADNTGTLSSGTLALDLLSYTGTLDDTNVNDAITISSGGSVADGALSANVSLLGQTVETSEITNGTILFADIAANGCNSGDIFEYNGSAWICGTDNDTTYSAGTGISMVGTVISSTLGTSIESGEITDGTITANDLGSDAVTTAKILNGTILFEDLGQNGCNAGEILRWNGSAWICDVDTAGSGTNTFATIATPAGTSPVADSSTDTLTLADGAGITITGDGTTDTVTIAAVLGTTVDLTSEVTGTLGLGNGGTNATTAQGAINNLSGLTTNGDILYFNGTNTTRLPRGSSNQCLLSNATTVVWGSCTAGGGGFTNLTLDADSGTPETISDTDTITIAGGTNASTTVSSPGTVTVAIIDNPTFAGLITANGGVTIQAGDTFTFNGDAFTDLTGTGLQIVSGSLETTLGSSIQDAEVDDNITIGATGSVNDGALSANVSLLGSLIDLATEITGTLGIGNGGTGATTAQGAINNISGLTTNGDLLYNNGTNSTRLARGTDGQCLMANATTILWTSCAGSGTTFFTLAGSTGTPQNINGGDTVTIAAGSSGNLTSNAGATDTVTVDIVSNPTFSGLVTLNAGAAIGAGQTLTISGDGISDFTGTGLTMSGGALTTTLGTSIDSTEIVNATIAAADLNTTNAAGVGTDDYVLTYDNASGGFTWVDPSTFGAYSFNISDGTTSETINNTNILNFTSGTNVSAVVSATDTLTISVVNNPTFSGLATLNGGLTVEAGDTFTFNGDAFTDLTGTGLQIVTGSLQTTLGTTVDLTSEVTGTLGLGNGGTNATTAQGAINNLSGLTTNGDILYFNGTNTTRLPRGSSNQCLLSNATTVVWGSCTAGGGGFTNLTLDADSGTPETISDTDTITIAGGTNASTTVSSPGTVTVAIIDNPTFAGLITANGGVTIQAGDTFTFNGDAFTDLTGTGLQIVSGSLETTLGSSISGSEIVNATIEAVDLESTNAAGAGTDNYVLTYDDATGGFTWVDPSTVGASYSFDVTDGTNTQTINSTNVLNFTSGTNVSAVVSATDTLTISVVNNPTFSGLATLNGGLTLEAGDTFTFNGDAFTDLTGTGLTISGGALETTLGTSIQDAEVDDNITIGATGSVNDGALSANVSLLGSLIDLTNEITNTLGIGNGGTGATTAQGAINNISGLTTEGDLLYRNATDTTRLARGTNGQCLTSNATTIVWTSCAGSGTTFFTLAGSTGTPQSINGGDTVTVAAGSSGNLTSVAGATDTVTVDIISNPTFSGLVTLNAGATIGAGQTLTINGDGFTDLTGTGLTISGGALQTTLGTSIDTTEIVNATIAAADLNSTNAAGVGTDDYVLTYDNASGGFTWVDPTTVGASYSFSVTDGTTSQTINNSNTLTFTSGTNVSAVVSATDTLTISVVSNPTFSGLMTLNGGLTVEAGDTFTFNSDAFTDLTGTGLAINAGALEAVLGTAIDTSEITNSTILFADIAQNGCSSGETIEWNGSAWICGTDSVGAGTNTFATIDAPNGTDPVADSTTDTLTLTDGAGITITGNGTTDTITVAAVLGATVDLTSEVTGELPVANGGTGANSASGARTNLGAAASGANSDITSLTALTAITPSAALTVGATGQGLTLQGSAATTITATDSGFTTTVGFVTPTANATINFPTLSAGTYQVCTTSGNCLGGGSGGANTALSNLSSVAINTSLLTGNGSVDLGSDPAAFRNAFFTGTLSFEGSTVDGNETTISVEDPTADVTYRFADAAAGTYDICTTDGNCVGGSGGGAPNAAAYVTIGNNATLTGERAITAGSNLSAVDGGADSTYTLNVVNNPTFSGLITANGGLTVEAGDTFTFNGDAFTDLTGTGLTISGGALQTTLGTSIQDAEVDDDITIGASGSVADGALSANVSLLGALIDLTTEITGTLGIGNGGTGATTAQGAINNISGLTTNGDLLYHNGTNSTRLARGSDTQCLLSTTTTIQWGTCTGDGVGIASLTLDADSGTPEALGDGNTITIAGGTDISTAVSATDTVTINNTSTLSSVTGRGATTTTLLNLDGGIAVDTTNFTVSGTNGDVVTAGDLAVNGGDLNTSAATFNLLNSTATTVNAFGAATSLNLGVATGYANLLSENLNVGTTGTTKRITSVGAGDFYTQTAAQSSASTNSGGFLFGSGSVSGATSNSGYLNIASGNSTTSGNTGNISILTGNAASGDSGYITIDNGTASGLVGGIQIGNTNSGSILLGRSGITTTNAGALTVTQALTANGSFRVTDGSSNYATIAVNPLANDYTLSIPTITANDTFCLVGLANCAGSATTLQGAYDADANGSDAVIALTSTDGALVLRDAASTIGTLFTVEANGGADYLSVASTGTTITGPAGGSQTALVVNQGAASNVGLTINGAASATNNFLQVTGFGEAYSSFQVDNGGRASIRPVTGGDGTALQVRNAAGTTTPFYVDTSTGYTYTYGQIVTGLVDITGATKYSVGGSNTTFTSPQSASITAKLAFDMFNPGSGNQLIALGLPSGADTNSRGISLFDNRAAGDNQAVLSVFSPDETDVFGLSSDGSNSYGYLKATSGLGLGVKIGTTIAATFETTGDTTLGYDLTVQGGAATLGTTTQAGTLVVSDGSSNTVTVGVNALAGNYTVNIPTITGSDTFCLASLNNCAGTATTLQGAYDADANGSDAVIALTSTDGALVLRDAASTIGTLFVVEANGGADYLSVASTGVTVGTGLTVTSGNSLTLANNTSCINLKTNSGGVVSCGANENTYVVAATDSVNTAAANYVADGDTGTANDGDQVQINSAITAANTAGGGVVQLLEGTYTIDASVLMLDNVILKGTGDGTIIRFAASYSPGVNDEAIENAGTVYDVEIRDLTIDVNDDAQTNDHLGGIALVAGSGSDGTSLRGATIDNVSIFDTKSYAISLDGSDHSTVNNVFIDCNNGGNNNVSLYFNATTNIRLSNSRITDCGILQVGGNHNTIVGNNISYTGYNHPTAGGALDVSSDYNTITGNTITSSFGPGIFADNNATITGNTIIGGNSYGIACISSGNITIGNNLIRDNGNDGINFNACSDVQISNNNIINNTGEGLYLTNSSSIANITITGNNFEANTDQGIEAWTGVHNLVISNNSFKQNATNAVYLNGANDNIVQGNSFYDNGSTGSNATLAISGDGNSAIGNNFYDSAGTSTFINIASGSDDTYLADNYFDPDSTYSAAFSDSGTGTIYANQVDANLALRAGAEASMYLQNSTNSTNALQVRNISGTALLNVDTSAASGTNLLINSGVESGTTNFAAKTSTTISQSSTYSYDGSHSLLAATTAAANGGANALYQLAASTQYSVSFYARLDSGSMTTAQIGYSTNGSTDTSCATGQTINTTWTRLSCTFTTGGSVSGTRYVYLKQTDASARNIYIDAVQLEAAASVSDYNLGSGKIYVSAPLTVNTLAVSSLGASDTSTYLCRNSSNLIAGCTVSPLSSSLTDNVADAFDLQEGTNNYININTTNGSENISFGNATTNPSFSFLGSGDVTIAGALFVGSVSGVEIDQDYIQFPNGGGIKQVITSSNGSGNSNSLIVGTGHSTAAAATTGDLTIITGDGSGTGTDSGSIGIDVGTATGIEGTISIGAANASALTIGNSGAALSVLGSSGSSFALNGVNVSAAEFNVLDAGIELGDLTTQGTATDEFCLTSETGGGALLAWQACSSTTLQGTYDNDADGSDAIIALTSADDSLIFRNPASSGSDSTYVLTVDQLNTGAKGGLYVNNAGTDNSLRVSSGGGTEFVVDEDGHVGIGDANPVSELTIDGNQTLSPNHAVQFNSYFNSGDKYYATDSAFQIWHDNTNDQLRIQAAASGTNGTAVSYTDALVVATNGNITLGQDLAVNGGDITTASGDLTINPAGGDTNITGNLAVSSMAAVTGDFYVGSGASSTSCQTLSLWSAGCNTQIGNYQSANTATANDQINFDNTLVANAGSASSAAYIASSNEVILQGSNNYTGYAEANYNEVVYQGSGVLDFATGLYSVISNTAGGDITSVYGIEVDTVNSGTGDITSGAGIWVTDADNSGSGTIGHFVGVSLDEQTGATNNTNLLVGTSSYQNGNWSIYNASTRDNVFAGELRIGSTSAPTVELDVTGDGQFSGDVSVNGNTTLGNASSDTLTVNATGTFNTDVNLTLAGTENVALTSTVTGTSSVDILSSTLTNQTSSGTQRVLAVTNANDAANAVTESLIFLDNAETTASTLTDAILITSSGVSGGVVDAIDVSAGNITNAINVGDNIVLGTTATIDFTNFDVSSAGAVTAVGVNSGTGLIQGSGGFTITGNASFATSAGNTVTLGNTTGAVSITGSSGSSFALNGVNVSAAEFNVLDAGIELGDLTTQGTATDEFCLTSETGGGALLAWQACGGSASLQGSYDGGNTITTTNARDIDITLANTATDANFDIVVASSSGSAFRIYNNATLAVSYDTTNGFNAHGSGLSSTQIGVGANAACDTAVAIGVSANVSTCGSGDGAVALGDSATAAHNGIALGRDAVANQSGAIALGVAATTAGFDSSIVLGALATATASNQLVIGGDTVPISDVYIGEGVTNATPTSTVLNATGGSGSNIAGANLTIAGGRSTGSAAGGSLLFQTSTAGGAGASLNALTTRLTIDSTGLSTFAGDVAVNSDDITTNQTSINLLNATATTVNAFGAATTLNIGAADGTTLLRSDELLVGNTGSSQLTGAGNAGFIVTSDDFGAASTNTGTIEFRSGDASGTTSNSGAVTLRSGNSTTSGNTGSLTIKTGNATSGASGAISIDTGTASTTAGAITIGTSASAKTVTIGNNTGTSAVDIITGSNGYDFSSTGSSTITAGGSLTVTASGGSTWSTSSGNLTVGATAASATLGLTTGSGGTIEVGINNTSTINIGSNANIARTINIGTSNGSQAQNITIGSTSTSASSLALRVGTGNFTLDGAASSTYALGASTTTGTIAIGGTAQTGNITLGSSSGSQSVLIGNGAGASTVSIANTATGGAINMGTAFTTGTITVGGTGTTGNIVLGQSTASNTISIGNANTATGNTQTINIGAGTPAGTGKATINIGNVANASALNLFAGTGNINLQVSGTSTIGLVQVGAGGAGSTTPDYFALDVKSTTGDPAGGAEGYMYYNTFDNKFRCYQGAAWTDCIAAGASTTLQNAYDNDANGSNAVIALSSTDGAVAIQDASSTIGELFVVENNGGATDYLSVSSVLGTTVSNSATITAKASLSLSGTGGITNATNTVNGSSTLFLSELQVGDRITINSQTRIVTAISANSGAGAVTVDSNWTSTVSGQTITRLPAALKVRTSTGTNKLVVYDDGKVNIGNSDSPTAALTVQDNTGLNAFRSITYSDVTTSNSTNATVDFNVNPGSAAAVTYYGYGSYYNVWGGASTSSSNVVNYAAGGTFSGNGLDSLIGFESKHSQFGASGTVARAVDFVAKNNLSVSGYTLTSHIGLAVEDKTTGTNKVNLFISAAGSDLTSSPTGGVDYSIYNASANSNVFAGSLRVGSTTAPTNALDVTGSATVSSSLTVNTNTLFANSSNGRVGIGTASPDTNLHVNGNAEDASTGAILKLTGSATSTTNDQRGANLGIVVSPGSSSSRNYFGVDASASSSSANLSSSAVLGGVTANTYYTGSSTVLSLTAGYFKNSLTSGTGSATNAYGLFVDAAVDGSSGSITNNYGLYLSAQTAGTNDYNIYSAGSGSLNYFEGVLQIADDTGLVLGTNSDATLKYDEAGDDRVELTGTNAGLFIEDRLTLGKTTLTLTDDGTANDTLTPTSSYVVIDADETGNGGVPALTISEASAKDGDVVIVANLETDGSNDTFTIAFSSGVVYTPGAATVTMGANDVIMFIYAQDRWLHVSYGNF